MGEEEKSTWNKLKTGFMDGFKPMGARADSNVKQNREETGNQLAQDMGLSAEERADRARRGFMKKIK